MKINNNCVDINNVALNEVNFNDDGTVVGILDTDEGQITTKLSYECCINNGWEFDPKDATCYWTPTCLLGGSYNIILNSEGDSGALFQVHDSEKEFCRLEVEFDWLLKFDCDVLETPLKTILESLKLDLKIEKPVYDESLPIPNSLSTLETVELFNIDNITTFFTNNENTGIFVDGNCDIVKNVLLNDLGENSGIITDKSLKSSWVNFKLVIDDPNTLETFFNQKLVISISSNNLYNFSILIDNVGLNKIIEPPEVIPPKFEGVDCPKFTMNRVVDNKKSWVSESGFNVRNFDLDLRKSRYGVNDDKLVINSKEIELSVNSANAVDNDVIEFIKLNDCVLSPATGCTDGHECVDLSPLITKPLTEVIDNNEFLNMLIDVKNRKTLSSYPTLDLLYYRYKNSLEHCGVVSNSLDGNTLDSFVDLLGTYWVDLLEQIVPATTIWGSAKTNSNNIFSSNTSNKYKYRKYSTLVCETISHSTPSPTSGSVNVEVISEDITTDNIITQKCDSITIKQINRGSEFIGTVSTDSKSIIETIDDSCNLYNICE